MRKSKSILIVLTLLLVLVLPLALAGCNNTEKGEFVDLSGTPITVKGPVDKIACIGTGVLRMITYAGVEDKLVGIEQTEIYQPIKKAGKETGEFRLKNDRELLFRPYDYVNKDKFSIIANDSTKIIGKGGGANPDANLEAIIALKPQVVFCSYNDNNKLNKLRTDLKKFDIPVVKVFIDTDIAHPTARENIRKSFNIIGKLCGAEERCNAVVEKIDDTFADLNNRTKDIKNRPNVYVGAISYRGRHGLDWTYSKFSCLQAINTPSIMDGKNPDNTAGPEGAFQTDFESLLGEGGPEYIFVDKSNIDLVKKSISGKNEIINKVNAVKNDNVYSIVAYNNYSTNIEYALSSAYYMGKIMYKDAFSDVDIKAKTNELTKFFVGVELYDTMVENNLYFDVVDINAI